MKQTDKMKLILSSVSLIHALPTVIWHGMGDYGESSGMKRMAQMILDNTGRVEESVFELSDKPKINLSRQ